MPEPTPDTQQHRRRWAWVVAGLAVIAIVVIAAVAFLVLRSVEDQQEGQDTLAATSVAESTLPQSLPFDYTAGHIVVDALPAGADAPIPFVLDSGAPNTYSDETRALDESDIDVPELDLRLALLDALGGREDDLDLGSLALDRVDHHPKAHQERNDRNDPDGREFPLVADVRLGVSHGLPPLGPR